MIVEDYSKIFLKPNIQDFEEQIGREGSSRNLSIKVVDVFDSEGYELHYDAELVLYANNEQQDTELIKIIIEPSFPPTKVESSNYPRSVELINFNSENFVIDGIYDSQTLDFQVLNNEANKIESIRVDVEVENSSGNYLRMVGVKSDEILSQEGDTTEFFSIPIEILDIEGREMKYKVNLSLYGNGQKMDIKQIDIIITRK